ncbi:TIM barrel protein [Siphonobacter aquaeclarae]|uniref:Sugar phosphate isomerase/epimerase n=1 Tax=Siphonobacter aquaeclarae TaxID=563176 RepID=A0A1G9PAP0_9BACT|nr:TIM barrel protein [Siphonobacter aquaeclarae]SDL95866.1 Sugar phosphate isomerase/epimerase [Siphonobacter aquaeclarae]
MNPSRRQFLKWSGAAVAGLSVTDLLAAPASSISLQLYSVRDDMKKNPIETLKGVAKAGYKLVEHAGYTDGKFYGMSPKEFKAVLTSLGLSMPSGHTVLAPQMLIGGSFFNDQWKKTVEDAAFLGQKYVISPWMPEDVYKTPDDLKRFMETFNKAGRLCQQQGMKFGYHNHEFEVGKFKDGQVIFDVMLQHTDPKLVTFEMDVAWITAPGSDPVAWFKKYPGRFELLHMKDLKKDAKAHHGYVSTEIGDGIVRFADILKNRKLAGAKYLVVEQEDYGSKTPLECIGIDYQRLSKLV